MARKDLEYGARTIARILKRLEEPADLAHKYALATLEQARQNASSKPTPQARMAAENMEVDGDTIAPASAGDAAEVAMGSEFGSGVYRQFHAPINPRGYWLFPAGEALSTQKAGDEVLEDILDRAIASGGLV